VPSRKTEKNVERWVTAGLLTPEQGGAIVAYEREHVSASWVLYGLTGLGCTVVLIGVISIIAANWDLIPPAIKLAGYFISLGTLALCTTRRLQTPGVLREALLTSFAGYVLAGIGLVGQIYNLKSNGYSALFFWLALILPAVLLTSSRLLNNIWFMGFISGITSWVADTISKENAQLWAAIVLSLPYLFIALGYVLGTRIPFFAAASRVWGFAVLLIPFAIAGNIAWSIGNKEFLVRENVGLGEYVYVPLLCAVCAAVTAYARSFTRSKLLTYAILIVLGAVSTLTLPPLSTPIVDNHPVIGCALFILAWAGAAAIAAAMERRRLFDIAAFVIGVRFIVVYFQVFGSLAATGIGLIVSGAVILSIAYGWFKYRGVVVKALQEAA